MSEQPRTSAYLGPDKGRWTPKTWADIVEAAAGGLLDESPWVDLKQELPAGKRTVNTDLAQDLAAFGVDGGMLVVGIEDRDSHAGKVLGVALAGLADRVDQVARAKVQPPLTVRSYEIPDPDRPGWGCLLVLVPPSPDAPHMVDFVYYGRGDRANHKLSDEQVRDVIESRRRGRADISAELKRMADDDPFPADRRKEGHLYVLVQPETAPEEALVELLGRPDAPGSLQAIATRTIQGRGLPAVFDPDIRQFLGRVRRAEGLALTSYDVEDGPRSEYGMVELVVREDGGVRLTCGRGTDAARVGYNDPDQTQRVIFATIVLGLTYSAVAFAGLLADEHVAYQGQWRLGVRMDRLLGVVPADRLSGGGFPFNQPGNAYSRDEYERVTTAYTEDLVTDPHAVTERLVAPLLRGLGIAPLYLPMKR